MGAACSQGGCCRQAPVRQVNSAAGECVRLNMLYYGNACFCGPRNPIDPQDMRCPDVIIAAEMTYRKSKLEEGEEFCDDYGRPLEAEVRGIWEKFMGEKGSLMQLQRKYLSMSKMPGCLLSMLLFILTLGLCCKRMCNERKRHLSEWDTAMRKWQADFNEELNPLGMSVKTQSNCVVTRGGNGEKQRHIERWFAFALTPEEGEKLAQEPHLKGDIEDHTCCGGVNENDLCMHPPDI